MQEEQIINKLTTLLNRLLKEKSKIEELLSMEVKEKQDLVLAFAKEKKNLTTELQTHLKDIRKIKHKIKKHMGNDTLKMLKQGFSGSINSNQSTPRLIEKVFNNDRVLSSSGSGNPLRSSINSAKGN